MDGNRKQVWRQLAVMYQGLLFLGGHVVDPGLATGEDRRARSRDATGEAAAHRHSRAQVRLDGCAPDACGHHAVAVPLTAGLERRRPAQAGRRVEPVAAGAAIKLSPASPARR